MTNYIIYDRISSQLFHINFQNAHVKRVTLKPGWQTKGHAHTRLTVQVLRHLAKGSKSFKKLSNVHVCSGDINKKIKRKGLIQQLYLTHMQCKVVSIFLEQSLYLLRPNKYTEI